MDKIQKIKDAFAASKEMQKMLADFGISSLDEITDEKLAAIKLTRHAAVEVAFEIPAIKQAMEIVAIPLAFFRSKSTEDLSTIGLLSQNYNNALKHEEVKRVATSKAAEDVEKSLKDAGFDNVPKRLDGIAEFVTEKIAAVKAENSTDKTVFDAAVAKAIEAVKTKIITDTTVKINAQWQSDSEALKAEKTKLEQALKSRDNDSFIQGVLSKLAPDFIQKNRTPAAEKLHRLAMLTKLEELGLSISEGKVVDESGAPYAFKGEIQKAEDIIRPFFVESGFIAEKPTGEKIPVPFDGKTDPKLDESGVFVKM